MSMQVLGRAIRHAIARRPEFVRIPLATAVLAGIITLLLPTEWTSQAVLEFPPLPSALEFVAAMDQFSGPNANGGGGMGAVAQLMGTNDPLKRCIAILKSERVRTQVVSRPALAKSLPRVLHVASKRKLARALAKASRFRPQPGSVLAIEVALPGPSKLAQVVLRHSPREVQEAAAATAQAYADELRGYLNDVAASHERAERLYIEPQVKASYQRLEKLQARQVALVNEGNGVPPKDEHPLLGTGLQDLEEKRAAAGVELAAAQRGRAAAWQRLQQVSPTKRSGVLRQRDPEVDRLKGLLSEAQTRYLVLRNTEDKSDKHPDVRRELESIKQLKQELGEAQRRPLQTASEQISSNPAHEALQEAYNTATVAEASSEAKLAALGVMREQVLARLRGLTTRQVEELRLEGDYQLEAATYALLRRALEEVRIREKRAAQVFVVLDSPQPPDRKSGPSLVKNVVLGLFLGLVLVIALLELEKLFPEGRGAGGAGTPAGPEQPTDG